MFRRVLLALLLTASMTFSGVSGCGSNPMEPCRTERESCTESSDCCEGLVCSYWTMLTCTPGGDGCPPGYSVSCDDDGTNCSCKRT